MHIIESSPIPHPGVNFLPIPFTLNPSPMYHLHIGYSFSQGMGHPGLLLEWLVRQLTSGDEARAEAAIGLTSTCLPVRLIGSMGGEARGVESLTTVNQT